MIITNSPATATALMDHPSVDLFILGGRFHGPTEPCAPELVNVPIDVDRTLPCVRLGVYLLTFERIPVVAMSASPLEGSEDWIQEAGFAGWLEKPIHVGTFPEQVRGFCGPRSE